MLALSLELTRHQVGQHAAPLPGSTGEAIGILVLFAFASDGIWRLARHMGVIAHEGAHASAGWGMGRKVTSVKLNSDATGETVVGPGAAPGTVFTGFAGYLGPSFFGLGAAVLIASNQIEAVLYVAIIFLFVMLFFIRNSFGFVSVLLNGGLIVLVLRYGSMKLHIIAAYALSWFLLFSGVRFVFMHGSRAKDADILRGITHIPRVVWAGLWLVITVIALWAGGHLLIGHPPR